MEGLSQDRILRAIEYAEAMHADQLPLAMEQGGATNGIDPEMAKYARQLAGEFGRGVIDPFDVAYLQFVVDYYEEEERECLRVGIDYRAALARSLSR